MTSATATWARLNLPDAELWLARDFLAPPVAGELFSQLHDEIAWETHHLRLFGRDVASPRLSCWIGDPDARYRYSGTQFLPRPWSTTLAALRAQVAVATGAAFNSVLANLYRDGCDGMGWHSDNEPELGPAPVIASLSLGAPRRFVLKHRRDADHRLAIELPSGSLLVMRGATQSHYRHALPKTARPVAARINLTFRQIR